MTLVFQFHKDIMSSKSRAFSYTHNNHTQDDQDRIQAIPCTYHVYGRETGESGTPHLQGFIYFPNPRSIPAIRKLLVGAHVEVTKSIPGSIEYCKKDGDFFESGTPPMSQKRKGESGSDAYEEAWALAKKGKIEEISPALRLRYYGTLLRIAADYQVVPPSQEVMDFHWYYGPSGSGKSLKARVDNPDHYLKLPNKWWDGYKNQACVIIDEWSPHHSVLADHLKRWADHHAFSAEIKGGTKCLRPPKLIITSNYSIDECFPGEENEPLRRRFKSLHFNKLN